MTIKHAKVSSVTDGADTNLVRPSDWNSDHVINGLALGAITSPSQITSDQNNYSPTSLATTGVLRINVDSFRSITGIDSSVFAAGQWLVIQNIGAGIAFMRHENASSTAANRMTLGGDIMLLPGDSLPLIYDGTSSRWRPTTIPSDLPGSGGGVDVIDLYDEFTGALVTTGNIGSLGWATTASGTPANAVSSVGTGHPGVTQWATGATSGNNTRVHLGAAAADAQFNPADLYMISGLWRITTAVTTMSARFGFGQDISAASFGTAGAFFQYDSSVNAAWQTFTRQASTSTSNTTSRTVTQNNWEWMLIIRRDASNWDFVLNGSLAFSHTANLPTTSGNVGWIVQTATTAARTIQIDSFRLRTIKLAQRFT